MFNKIAILSGLIVSTTCMVLHQAPIPIYLTQYPEPNYNFAYDVNDAHTGDIKSQHESRRGDTVLGQYSLIQPDGVRRTVDYSANDHTGFLATVNNQNRQPTVNQHNNGQYSIQEEPERPATRAPAWPQSAPNQTPAPAAVSRTSLLHQSYNGHNPWL